MARPRAARDAAGPALEQLQRACSRGVAARRARRTVVRILPRVCRGRARTAVHRIVGGALRRPRRLALREERRELVALVGHPFKTACAYVFFVFSSVARQRSTNMILAKMRNSRIYSVWSTASVAERRGSVGGDRERVTIRSPPPHACWCTYLSLPATHHTTRGGPRSVPPACAPPACLRCVQPPGCCCGGCERPPRVQRTAAAGARRPTAPVASSWCRSGPRACVLWRAAGPGGGRGRRSAG